MHLYVVADVLTAPDLGRTHPLLIQAAWKPLPVEDGARPLDVIPPDARADAVVGASRWGMLRHPRSEADRKTPLQLP